MCFRIRSQAVVSVGLWGLILLGVATNVAALTDAQAKLFFNKQGCNACHGINEYRLAPSFEQIALRYAGQPRDNLVERLSLKIRHGGSGAWGTTPMISYPKLSADQRGEIVSWILNLSKPAGSAQ